MHRRFGALVVALALLLVLVPSATATDLHAVPSGGSASGSCALGSPCTLTRAFAVAADADDIRLASGTYDLPSQLTLNAAGAYVQPEAGAATRPVLRDVNATSATALLINADGVTVRGLRVEGSTSGLPDDLVAFAGIHYGGQFENMEVVQTGAAAALSGIGLTVRDSLVVNQNSAGVAGLMSGMVIGSTFISDSGNGVALEISSARFPSTDYVVVRNTILRGGPGSGGRDLRITDSDNFGPKGAAADVDFSNFRTGKVSQPFGGGSFTNGPNNQTTVDPLLVNLAGGVDVHQQDASPTIGAGSLADASTSTTDWEGDPRTIGVIPDIGADEAVLAPEVAGSSVGSITSTGATVSGDVTPNGAPTTYRVQYGLTASYGSATAPVAAGAGAGAVSVDVPFTGLTASTTYHARLVAQNGKGTFNGPDLVFTTTAPVQPPSVSGTSAGSITTGGATVSGTVNPNGTATTYKVEFGLTAAYGSSTSPIAAGSGSVNVAASVPITGLTSSTTYHARLVAQSGGGTTNGPDLTFTTGDLPPAVSGTSAGAITTGGATVSGNVNPNRVATTYKVEFGLTAAYGSSTASTPAGSGSSVVAASVPLTGLTSSTTYHARLVATSAGGTTNGPDLVFTTGDLPPTVAGTTAGSITTSGATVSGSVNPNRVATTYRVEYGLTAAYGSATSSTALGSGSSAVAVNIGLTGLAASTTYHARLVAMSAGGTTNGPDLVFTTADLPPSVSGTAVGSITTTGASVSGNVNPNSVATTYKVEYGLTAAYGSATTSTAAGSGSSAVAVSLPLSGLAPSTTYHVRLVATSAAGTTNGPDVVFTTAALPPSVSGTTVGSITTTGASVSGNVNPNSAATTYKVEYGTTAAYGSVTSSTSAGSGSSAVAAGVPLAGLTPSTTYHVRLVATSAGGTTNGPDVVFTTADLPPSVTSTSVGSVTTTDASVSGNVNPNSAATTYKVEYGPTAAYGTATSAVSAGAGAVNVAVSVPLSGLTPSSVYHARLVATNAGGTTNGPDLVFGTGDLPPSVSSTAVGSVTASGASVSGSVNPNSVATTYTVEYGTTLAYGSVTSAISAGSGASDVAVSVPLTGLISSTTYHARLVATSAGGTTPGPDLTFTTGDLPPAVSGTSVGSVTTTGATVSGNVNPNRLSTTYKVEFGLTAAYGSTTSSTSAGSGSAGVGVSVPLTGLGTSTTYHARLVATSAGGTTNGPDLVLTTGNVPPTVSGTSAGSITTTGATISGNVNPNAVATTYKVEYGLTAGYGSTTTSTAAGSGSSAVAASVPLSGLTSSTTYHARLVATSTGGTTNGPDVVFTTADLPPSVSGTSVGSVTTTGATVSGTVNPNRVATTYKVEYGTTAAYGSSTSATSAGSGSSAVAVGVPVSGLAFSTTYHARLVATSAGGTTNGPDLVFTTSTPAPSVANTSVGSVTAGGATVSGDVNPNGGATTYKVEFGLTAAYGSVTPSTSAGSGLGAVSAAVPLAGLTASTTYHARLVATSTAGTTNGPDLTFTTGAGPPAPSVSGTTAASVTASGATVYGNVNPNATATTYSVEFGPTTAYGSVTSAVSAGSGASNVAVSVPLTGLTSSTAYHARLVATSTAGTTNGPDVVFTTADLPPAVLNTTTGGITAGAATVTGDVNPLRVATAYKVEFGLTAAYGSSTSSTSAGSGSGTVAASVPLSGLTASTTYHARLVATSAGGTTNGPDLIFTTAPAPASPPAEPPVGPPPAGAPTTPPPGPGPGSDAPVDRVAPRLAAKLGRRSVRRGKRAMVRVLASEDVTVVMRVRGRRARLMLTTAAVKVSGGTRVSLKLTTRVRRRALRRGLYRVVVLASDAAGNTATRTVRLRVR